MRFRPLLPGLLLTAATIAVPIGTASAHDPGGAHSASADAKRHELLSGTTTVPLVGTPNVHFVTTVPDLTSISGCFAKSAPYYYVSTVHSIGVYDVHDPLAPKLTGVLPNLVFENEAMNCGEKVIGGSVVRFVLVGIDQTQASTDDIAHIRPIGYDEFLVVDVTDPQHPTIRSRGKTSSSTHTVACVRETACDYVYTAGGSVIDLTDLDNRVRSRCSTRRRSDRTRRSAAAPGTSGTSTTPATASTPAPAAPRCTTSATRRTRGW